MNFGIVSDVYGIKLSLEDTLFHLAKVGFKDIEIVSAHVWQSLGTPFTFPSHCVASRKLKKVKEICRNLGISIQQVHGPYGGNDLVADSERKRGKNIDAYKRWIDYCLILEAKFLIIHLGGRSDLCPIKDMSTIKGKNIDSLSQLVEYIGNEHLNLAIENLPRHSAETPSIFNMYGNSISDLKEIIKALKSSKVGICLDTGHANIENIDIPTAIKEAGKDLVATHIQENNGIRDMHMFPFSLRPKFRKTDWFSIFKAFKENNYPYPLIGECANSSGELPIWLLDIYLKVIRHYMPRERASRRLL